MHGPLNRNCASFSSQPVCSPSYTYVRTHTLSRTQSLIIPSPPPSFLCCFHERERSWICCCCFCCFLAGWKCWNLGRERRREREKEPLLFLSLCFRRRRSRIILMFTSKTKQDWLGLIHSGRQAGRLRGKDQLLLVPLHFNFPNLLSYPFILS